jgi:predicted O-methyltransferase YrrM
LTNVDRRQAGEASVEFAAAWTECDQVPGWLTRDQALALWTSARDLPKGGCAVEIGSHQGRSTVALGHGARGAGGMVVAIDPFLEGHVFGGQRTRERFERNITRARLNDVVHLEPDYSEKVLARWSGQVDLLFIDGKHDFWSCTKDIGWVKHMHDGARVFVHDAFSSVGVTTSLLAEMLRPSTRLRYTGRSGSLAAFTVGRPSVAQRAAVGRELGWFCRNLIIKVLLRLRFRSVTRLLGHRSPHDPY